MATVRDDFSAATKRKIGKRAGWLCSAPFCRAMTVSATADGSGEINVGHAAHIYAASPGGPRYDPAMTPEQRSAADNGLWLCRDHGTAIDADPAHFTVEMLKGWKRSAELLAFNRVLRNQAPPPTGMVSDIRRQMLAAAEEDLAVYRNSSKWPRTSVPLILKIENLDEPVTTADLAHIVASLDDVILVAPPGMGKTGVIFQVAEALLSGPGRVPVIVPLGDWATEPGSIVESILRRPAFRMLTEAQFRCCASDGGLVLLLDGLNEVDGPARERARVQIERLRAELPSLSLLITSRRQILDIPFSGKLAELLPLNEGQQSQIADAIGGEGALRALDRAWRTAGVADLIAIPLYLRALVSLPPGAPFPTTKEEILSSFVAAQERDPRRAHVLQSLTEGLTDAYLEELAAFAILNGNTTINGSDVRRSISVTTNALIDDGQITSRPRTAEIYTALIDNHLLVPSGEGATFQHQQFLEWYASHRVEKRILTELQTGDWPYSIQADVFDIPAWEEPLLFAIERMARGDQVRRQGCVAAILAAFEVDPILAAEMIHRATDRVWSLVSHEIIVRVLRWHNPGKVDRAYRFMLTSGRPEFGEQVWPLLVHEDDQISLEAQRNCKRFRTSVLGPDAAERIKSLPSKVRQRLLAELAYDGAPDGLELAAAVAAEDPDPEVETAVAQALLFRSADRLAARVLASASASTFDRLVRARNTAEISDPGLRERFLAAKIRAKENSSPYQQLDAVFADVADRSSDVTALIGTLAVKGYQDPAIGLIRQASDRYGRAIAEGLLHRVLQRAEIFYDADDIIAACDLRREDEELLAIAKDAASKIVSDAAASALGPISTGKLLDELFGLRGRRRKADGTFDEAVGERYREIEDTIGHVAGGSLVAAIKSREGDASNEQRIMFAELLARHPQSPIDHGRPFGAADKEVIANCIISWGAKLLEEKAERRLMSELARLAAAVPNPRMLPVLKRMCDYNLERLAEFVTRAKATQYRPSRDVDEARWPQTYEYQRAFEAIPTPECTDILKSYLRSPELGPLAAEVLTRWWIRANDPDAPNRFGQGLDYSRIKCSRQKLKAEPDATCPEAEAIFEAIESLWVGTAEERTLALSLAVPAVRLPFGNRRVLIAEMIAACPRRSRSNMLLNLARAGHVLDGNVVRFGIDETLKQAKVDTWILTQSDSFEVRGWLQLLPLSDKVQELPEVLALLPQYIQRARIIREALAGLAGLPSPAAEDVFFELAETYPAFYAEFEWREEAFKFGDYIVCKYEAIAATRPIAAMKAWTPIMSQ